MSQTSQILPEFIVQPRRYVVINSDNVPAYTRVAGMTIRVPARNERIQPGTTVDNYGGFFSALDDDNTYIPGTLVVEDRFEPNADGEAVLSFNATDAIRYILGVNPRTGRATSVYTARGLSLLPRGSNRKALEEIRRQGYERSEAWRIAQAELIIRDFDLANQLRVKKSMPEIPGGQDYVQAALLVRAARERQQRLIAGVMEEARAETPADAQKVSADLAAETQPFAPEEQDDDAALMEMIKSKIVELTPGPNVTETSRAELLNKLFQDPEAVRIMRKKLKVKPKWEKNPKRDGAPTQPINP